MLIYDHRGLGRSDKPDVPYSTRLFAKDCAGLMDALGIKKAHVMGHSMGGRVAQWLALDYPDKIRSLVLSGSGSGKYSELLEDYPRGVPMDAALEMIEKGYEKYQHDHWGPGFMFSEQFMKEHPEVVKKYQELIVDEVPPLKCYLRHVVARQCHETTDIVDRIKAPTLVIVGSKDTHEGGTGSHVDSAKALADKIRRLRIRSSRGRQARISKRDARQRTSADTRLLAPPLNRLTQKISYASLRSIASRQRTETVRLRSSILRAPCL